MGREDLACRAVGQDGAQRKLLVRACWPTCSRSFGAIRHTHPHKTRTDASRVSAEVGVHQLPRSHVGRAALARYPRVGGLAHRFWPLT